MMLGPRSAFAIVLTPLILAACASVPTLQFTTDEEAGTPQNDGSIADSTVTSDGSSDGGVLTDADSSGDDDANQLSDAEFDPDADAGPPRYKCGAKLVASCAACDGNPMLCLDNGRDECLADCTMCNTNLAPCVRCLPNGKQVGQCVAPGTAGVVACGHSAERCPCVGDAAACPSFAGAFQTCFNDGTGLGCETCGELGTANAVCQVSAGVFGKCIKQGAKAGTCK